MQIEGKSMLRLQIGPVQDFIAAARTSRDLWSGSYLLSRLMVAALLYLEQQEDVEVVFPSTKDLSICRWWAEGQRAAGQWIEGAEAPCLSNKLVACVPTARAGALAQEVRKAVQHCWQSIATHVWDMLPVAMRQDTARQQRYNRQVKQHLAVDYAHLPMDLPQADIQRLAAGVIEETPLTRALQLLAAGDDTARYATIYYLVDHCMNAVRKVNNYTACNEGLGRDAGWYAGADWVKDYLTGKEEQVFCMKRDISLCRDWKYARYLTPYGNDALGAITLIKRLWYVDDMCAHEQHLPALDARCGPNAPGKRTNENHYYAVLAMDGDNIGAALTRQNEAGSKMVDMAFHRLFSSSLAEFAQKKVGAIVKAYGGDLIYAGGDDVLALLPLQIPCEGADKLSSPKVATAVDCAAKLGEAFRLAMEGIRPGMTVSAGLAFVHSSAPLQDAVAAARRAESRAKSALGRKSFSISLMKRSGEIVEWGARWESGARELLSAWQECIDNNLISAKGAHRYAELLTPYMSRQNRMVSYEETAAYAAVASRIALVEFDCMLGRQWEGGAAHKLEKQKLRDAFEGYVQKLVAEVIDQSGQKRVLNPADELVPMCSVIAFMGRTSGEK